ncbi:hypothetical protein M2243_001044 [Heliophilum fasciatum]|nr:hypothetical protein [Heliophilum fasciatum]
MVIAARTGFIIFSFIFLFPFLKFISGSLPLKSAFRFIFPGQSVLKNKTV